jgi:hypothetical protein
VEADDRYPATGTGTAPADRLVIRLPSTDERHPLNVGPLAAALAKAQAAFPTIERTREVRVVTRTGGNYTFRYAPLDTILAAVRGPLSSNGLAVTQLLDGPELVTVLLHESGATLTARSLLPHNDGDTIQQLGSAITYLRRYALQAMLGIASEEDDDGNAAVGNKAADVPRRPAAPAMAREDGGLVGKAEVGKGATDFELRLTPDGFALAFRLVEGRKGIKVVARNALAEWLAEHRADIEGQRVICHGTVSDETFTPKDTGKPITYQVLHLTRIESAAGTFPDPATESAPEPEADTLADLPGWGPR